MRLLPRDPEIGWMPYLWLVYLGNLFVFLVLGKATAGEWVLTLAGLAAFLVLYFRSFWVKGRAILPMVAGMAVLGLLFSPFNPGATVFFVYAGAAAAHGLALRQGVTVIAALVAALGLEARICHIPPQGWVPGVVFTLFVGVINLFYADRRRAGDRLRLAHDEIARLAKVAERERIARDLHDLLGHTLSLITLKAELAGRLVERDPARAANEIREVERVSRQALAEVREAVSGYRGTGLPDEIARARQACAAAGIRLDVTAPELTTELALPLASERGLALALREAVTNVVRHSDARSCHVRLARRAGEAVLEVEDDGHGGSEPEGSGLAGMRERIELLGGRVERDGSAGTRLAVFVPLVLAAGVSVEETSR